MMNKQTQSMSSECVVSHSLIFFMELVAPLTTIKKLITKNQEKHFGQDKI